MRLPVFLLLFVVRVCIAQTGPGGIASNDGTSDLVLWLSTSDLQQHGFINGDDITGWADLSGFNSDAVVTGNPNFISGELNGHPVIRFTAANAEYIEGTLNSVPAAPISIIAVGFFSGNPQTAGTGQYIVGLGGGSASQASISREGNPSESYYSFDGSARSVGAVVSSQWHSFVSIHNTIAPFHSVFIDNIAQPIINDYPAPFASTNASFSLGRNASGLATTYLDGDIAEIIVLSRLINDAERNIISNYLASKFALSTPVDLYAFDTPAQGNFDLQVAGIGREVSGAQTSAASAGMYITELSGMQAGDYFLIGHRSNLNTVNRSDINAPGNALEGRWSRTWAIDVTDANASALIDVTFDFSESGLSGSPGSAGNYRLIRSNGTSWTIVSSAATVIGDHVTFSGIQLSDGIYTLASAHLVSSPLSNTIVNFLNGPAGIGSTDGSDGLLMWLDAAAITGLNNNDNIPLWNDLVLNNNSAAQPSTTLQPHYLTNQQNNLPVVNFDGADDFLVGNLGPLSAPMTVVTVARFNSATQGADDNDYVFDLGIGAPLFDNPGLRASISRRMSNDIPTRTNRFYTFAGDAFHYGPEISGQTFHSFTSVYQTATPFHQLYFDGSLAATAPGNTALNTNGNFHLGRLIDQPSDFYLNGDIAELIIYNTVLNSAQITVLQNSLSAKWNTIVSPDYYAGDQASNGDHDLAVSGVGRMIDGDMAEGRSAGLNISLSSDALTNSVMMFGHNLATNSVLTTDIAASNGIVTQRVARTWYVSMTGAVGTLNNIQFDYSEMGIAGSPSGNSSDFGLLYRATNSGSWTIAATGSSLSGDRVNFSNVNLTLTGAGFYTLASLNGAALPVILLSFNAAVVRGDDNRYSVNLAWSTSLEDNNNFFTLERSADGRQWKSLSVIPGTSSVSTKNDYNYVDRKPLPGRSYYRLKQTDLDGTLSQIGNVKTIYVEDRFDFYVFPNPAVDELKISIVDVEEGDYKFVVTDISSKTLATGYLGHDRSINLAGLKNGLYQVSIISSSGRRETTRFILKK